MEKASNDVDVARFQELSDGDPQSFRELVELYLSKTAEQLSDLEKAIATRAGPQVSRMSHSLVGANLMVGLGLIVPALRQLEAQGEKGEWVHSAETFKEVTNQFQKIKQTLEASLQKPPA